MARADTIAEASYRYRARIGGSTEVGPVVSSEEDASHALRNLAEMRSMIGLSEISAAVIECRPAGGTRYKPLRPARPEELK